MVLTLEGSNRTSKRLSLELRLVLLLVLPTLLFLVLRHDPKIYNPHMTTIIHSEVVQFYVLVQEFCFGVQKLDCIKHLEHQINLGLGKIFVVSENNLLQVFFYTVADVF
jgi:hypothetical protein